MTTKFASIEISKYRASSLEQAEVLARPLIDKQISRESAPVLVVGDIRGAETMDGYRFYREIEVEGA